MVQRSTTTCALAESLDPLRRASLRRRLEFERASWSLALAPSRGPPFPRRALAARRA